MSLLLVRADATETIGTGHVMRQLALSLAWQQIGGTVAHLGRVTIPSLDRRSADAKTRRLPISAVTLQADVDETASVARELGASCIIVDHYGWDSSAFTQLRRATKARIVVVNDLLDEAPAGVDVLLNPARIERGPYDRPSPPPDACLLLGPRYALLRPEFSTPPALGPAPGTVRRVLVLMGGSDPLGTSLLVVQALLLIGRPLDIEVVVGPASPWERALSSLVERAPPHVRITIAHDPHDLPGRMAGADIAISAAGSTAWELCAVGTPAALLAVADNQRPVVGALAAVGAAFDMGDARAVDQSTLAAAVAPLLDAAEARSLASSEGRRLVDGRGALRVATLLRALVGPLRTEDVTFRAARPSDAVGVWWIANHPSTRASSLSAADIPLDQHLAWYQRKLASPTTRLVVATVGDVVAATLRLDRQGDAAEISYAVAPWLRGFGLGALTLQRWNDLAQDLKVSRARAVVRSGNEASCRAFMRLGFVHVKNDIIEREPCLVFEKDVS